MNALFLIGYSEGTGLTFHLAALAEAMAKELPRHGIDFKLLSTEREQNEGLLDMCRNTLGNETCIFRIHASELYEEIENLISKFNYKSVLICTQGPRQVLALRQLKKKFPRTVKIEVRINSYRHGTLLAWPTALAQSLIYKALCDCVNFQTIETFHGWKTLPFTLPGRSVCIPLGMEKQEFVPCTKTQKQIFAKNTFNITYLARFDAVKQHAALLRAIKPLLKEHSNLRVNLFGDGPLLKKTEEWIAQNGLTEKIKCMGRIDRKHVPWILSQTHCAVVASQNETFGHCILEPLACGVPVISTNVGVAPAVISDFHNGFIIKESIEKELPEYLQAIIRNSELQNSLKIASIESVKNYTWGKVASTYRHLFHQLFNG